MLPKKRWTFSKPSDTFASSPNVSSCSYLSKSINFTTKCCGISASQEMKREELMNLTALNCRKHQSSADSWAVTARSSSLLMALPLKKKRARQSQIWSRVIFWPKYLLRKNYWYFWLLWSWVTMPLMRKQWLLVVEPSNFTFDFLGFFLPSLRSRMLGFQQRQVRFLRQIYFCPSASISSREVICSIQKLLCPCSLVCSYFQLAGGSYFQLAGGSYFLGLFISLMPSSYSLPYMPKYSGTYPLSCARISLQGRFLRNQQNWCSEWEQFLQMQPWRLSMYLGVLPETWYQQTSKPSDFCFSLSTHMTSSPPKSSISLQSTSQAFCITQTSTAIVLISSQVKTTIKQNSLEMTCALKGLFDELMAASLPITPVIFNFHALIYRNRESNRNREQMNQKCTSLDVSDIISRLVKAKDQIRGKFPLSQDEVTSLCSAFKSVLIIQPLLLELVPPLHICGDIHGQYSDLLNIFQRLGEPSSHNYLFLGDYVDRGKKSLESICLLMACKVKHPLTFFLLRGNHQSSKLNKTYGFYDQCKRKMGIKAFKTITEAFNYLPVCAVVGQRIFCVHGGLSPLVDQLSAINCIKRPVQIEDNKIISDLLWSDPNPKLQGWEFNFERGVSVTYGKRVLDSFLKKYDFDFVCRSHQVVEEGYQFLHARTLLTVFSVPNYCGQFQNFGAVLSITADMVCSLVQLKGNVNHSGKIQRKLTPLKAVSYDELKEKSNKMSEKEAVLNDQKASVASRKQTLYPQDLNVLVQQKLGQVDARMQLREQNCQKK